VRKNVFWLPVLEGSVHGYLALCLGQRAQMMVTGECTKEVIHLYVDKKQRVRRRLRIRYYFQRHVP
jgi:hypothetical protein